MSFFLFIAKCSLVLLLGSTIFLPLVAKNDYPYHDNGVSECKPNAGVTYVEGYLYQGQTPVNGDFVAFGVNPNGPAIARIQAGPHPGYTNWPNGFFSHILSATGPRAGMWFFWVEDATGKRLSTNVSVITTAFADQNGCQQAKIFFRK